MLGQRCAGRAVFVTGELSGGIDTTSSWAVLDMMRDVESPESLELKTGETSPDQQNQRSPAPSASDCSSDSGERQGKWQTSRAGQRQELRRSPKGGQDVVTAAQTPAIASRRARPRPPQTSLQTLQHGGNADASAAVLASSSGGASSTPVVDEQLAELCTCPITQELFTDPVIAKDGFTYERAAISEWIQRKGTSPMTDVPLVLTDLRSSAFARQLLEACRADL